MSRHGSYGPPPADPDRTAAWIHENDLATTMHRRGLVVRRPCWWTRRPRPGGHVPLDERIAADPHRVVREIARHVASELRATGQAVTIPGPQQTLHDRLRESGPLPWFVGGAAAALLIVLALLLFVWQVT